MTRADYDDGDDPLGDYFVPGCVYYWTGPSADEDGDHDLQSEEHTIILCVGRSDDGGRSWPGIVLSASLMPMEKRAVPRWNVTPAWKRFL